MTYPPTPEDPGASQPDYLPYQPPQPQYGPPPEQYGPPPQPQYGPPPSYAPQYGPPPEQPAPYSLMPPPPAPPRHRGRLLTTLAAVVVLVGGGAATYVALSNTASDHGAASARKAVQTLVSDINSSDVIGMLDSLAPAERVAIADPLIKDFDELKRTHVLSGDADLSHFGGAAATFSGLTYGDNITINDHVEIVQITGGTVHVATDLSKLPFSSEFLQTVGMKRGLSGTHSQTVNIGDAVRANGAPVRIAAENVGGRWYPSLLYTIAYYATEAAGLPQPTAKDALPAVGADSPVDAVKTLIHALLGGDIVAAIQVASPTELAALHDYAGVIIKQVGTSYPAAPVTLERLDLHSAAGPNGSQVVALDGFAARVEHLGEIALQVDGDCIRLTLGTHTERLCADQETHQLAQLFKQLTGTPLTDAQQQALQDLSSVTNVGTEGFITSQAAGKWFVNPIQTFMGGTTSLLQQFKDNDLLVLIGLFKELVSSPLFFGVTGGSGGGSMCIPPPGATC